MNERQSDISLTTMCVIRMKKVTAKASGKHFPVCSCDTQLDSDNFIQVYYKNNGKY